jgi:hypothetical protein
MRSFEILVRTDLLHHSVDLIDHFRNHCVGTGDLDDALNLLLLGLLCGCGERNQQQTQK